MVCCPITYSLAYSMIQMDQDQRRGRGISRATLSAVMIVGRAEVYVVAADSTIEARRSDIGTLCELPAGNILLRPGGSADPCTLHGLVPRQRPRDGQAISPVHPVVVRMYYRVC